jgi:hypothetical protein
MTFDPNQKNFMNFSEEKMISACMVTRPTVAVGKLFILYTSYVSQDIYL